MLPPPSLCGSTREEPGGNNSIIILKSHFSNIPSYRQIAKCHMTAEVSHVSVMISQLTLVGIVKNNIERYII